MTLFPSRYQILAASAIPAGFIDGKVAATKLIEAMQLDESEYKIGNTKVFFRSGIVGKLSFSDLESSVSCCDKRRIRVFFIKKKCVGKNFIRKLG